MIANFLLQCIIENRYPILNGLSVKEVTVCSQYNDLEGFISNVILRMNEDARDSVIHVAAFVFRI